MVVINKWIDDIFERASNLHSKKWESYYTAEEWKEIRVLDGIYKTKNELLKLSSYLKIIPPYTARRSLDEIVPIFKKLGLASSKEETENIMDSFIDYNRKRPWAMNITDRFDKFRWYPRRLSFGRIRSFGNEKIYEIVYIPKVVYEYVY